MGCHSCPAGLAAGFAGRGRGFAALQPADSGRVLDGLERSPAGPGRGRAGLAAALAGRDRVLDGLERALAGPGRRRAGLAAALAG